MYCENCGTKGDGKFCPNCGTELVPDEEHSIEVIGEDNAGANNAMDQNNNVNTLSNTSDNYLAISSMKQSKKKNTPLGIAAFVLSFFGPFAFIGLILGIVDLVKDKSKSFKHGISIAAIAVSCVILIIIFVGSDDLDDNPATTTKTEVTVTEDDTTKEVESTTQKANETAVQSDTMECDLEKAKRAAVVAITNGTAYDIFDTSGNEIDITKLHSYSDLSGNYLIVKDWGTWVAKDEKTWHAEGLALEIADTGLEIKGKADVSFDGKNYIVSNLDGAYGVNLNLSDLEKSYKNPQVYLTISPNLVEEDRNEEKATGLPDNSDILEEDIAMSTFGMYTDEMYPYGIKLHWITGTIAHTQDKKTGEWFFKVKSTITNGFGAKYDTIVEGRVSGTNDNPKVTYFHEYH